jgi:hypothetical protein
LSLLNKDMYQRVQECKARLLSLLAGVFRDRIYGR